MSVPVGRRAEIVLAVTDALIDHFAALSGDDNRLHMDAAFARERGFGGRVAHGAISVAAISRLIGTELPGHGALWRRLRIDWVRPVYPGDTVTIAAEVTAQANGTTTLRLEGQNQNGLQLFRAEALVGAADASDEPAAAPRSAPIAVAPTGAARAVLVTGGARGIGRAVAEALGRAGYAVAVGFHTSEGPALELAAALREAGGAAVAVPLDVADPAGVLASAQAAEAELGPLLGLVHAATPEVTHAAIPDLSLADFDRFWNAYVRSVLPVVQHVYANIERQRWGRLVFLGTSWLSGPPPARVAPYITAKAALYGLTRSLAVELGPLGGTANMISPGMTRTDLNRHATPRTLLTEAQKTPLRRLAEPEDTAGVAAFLFSDAGGFVTGLDLQVSGGATMA